MKSVWWPACEGWSSDSIVQHWATDHFSVRSDLNLRKGWSNRPCKTIRLREIYSSRISSATTPAVPRGRKPSRKDCIWHKAGNSAGNPRQPNKKPSDLRQQAGRHIETSPGRVLASQQVQYTPPGLSFRKTKEPSLCLIRFLVRFRHFLVWIRIISIDINSKGFELTIFRI